MKLYQVKQLPSLVTELRIKPKSCSAFIFCEDSTLIDETLTSLINQKFGQIFLFITEPEQYRFGENIHNIQFDFSSSANIWSAINSALPNMRHSWVYWGLNGEFFYYPFCETRTVRDLSTFLEGERHLSIFGTVVDLYAGDLTAHDDGIAMDNAYFDSVNYYAEPGEFPDHEYEEEELERIQFLYGGLRWRFQEFMPWQKELRRIDRIPFFYVTESLWFDETGFTRQPEFYTYKTPTHASLTCAVASFRAARYLRHNHDYRQSISKLIWEGSEPFHWDSMQFLRKGFIETGQWF